MFGGFYDNGLYDNLILSINELISVTKTEHNIIELK